MTMPHWVMMFKLIEKLERVIDQVSKELLSLLNVALDILVLMRYEK